MEEALSFFRAFEAWIYLLLGLGGLFYLRKFFLAWWELQGAGFGLERGRQAHQDSAGARAQSSAEENSRHRRIGEGSGAVVLGAAGTARRLVSRHAQNSTDPLAPLLHRSPIAGISGPQTDLGFQ